MGKTMRAAILGVLALATMLPVRGDTPAAPSLPNSQQTLQYLNQTLDWYQGLGAQEQVANAPSDLLYFVTSRQTATKALQLSFDFARG